MAEDDDSPWYRSLVTGIGALLGVALIIGGVISLVTLGVVNLSGIGGSDGEPRAEPSLYMPELSESPGAGEDDGPSLSDLNGGVSPTQSESADASSKSPKAKKKRKPKPPSVISLSASPVEVRPMQQIYLSGTYPGGEGASLQVQRFEGAWTDFPSSASVSGGTFTTYVMTGQTGPNKFRVVDSARGKKSNPVTVTVR